MATILKLRGCIKRRETEGVSASGLKYQTIYIDNSSQKNDGSVNASILKVVVIGDKVDVVRTLPDNVWYDFRLSLKGEFKDWQGKTFHQTNLLYIDKEEINAIPTQGEVVNTQPAGQKTSQQLPPVQAKVPDAILDDDLPF